MKFSSRYQNNIKNFIFSKWGLSNSSRRTKYVKKWLESIKDNETILDAGAGPQQYKKYTGHLKYTSQDFGLYEGGDEFGDTYINHQEKSFNSKTCDIISDITNIPREDSSFQNIICTEVFEHLPNPMAALKEFSRLLKNGGKLMITAPFRCLYHQTPYFFYSGFSKYWYEYHAKEYGFEVYDITPNGNYFEDIAQEVFRIISLGNVYKKIFSIIFSLPYLIYLFLIDRIFKTKGPESCWGYHVILIKK